MKFHNTAILGINSSAIAFAALLSTPVKAGVITFNAIPYTYTTINNAGTASTVASTLSGSVTYNNTGFAVTASSLFGAWGVSNGSTNKNQIQIIAGTYGTQASPLVTLGSFTGNTYSVVSGGRTIAITFASSPFANQTNTAVSALTISNVTATSGGGNPTILTGGGVAVGAGSGTYTANAGTFTTTQAPAPAIALGLGPIALLAARKRKVAFRKFLVSA